MGCRSSAQVFVVLLLLAASLYAMSDARTILVGGDFEHWHAGYDCTDWALENGPVVVNDTLVFRYDPPTGYSTSYSFNLLQTTTCDLRKSKLLANPYQGIGEGFVYRMNQPVPLYFASGEDGGPQCACGLKFAVMPLLRWINDIKKASQKNVFDHFGRDMIELYE